MSSNDIFNVTLNAVGGKLKTSETGQMNIKVENYSGKSYHCKSVTIKVPVGDFTKAVYYNDNKTVFSQTISKGRMLPDIEKTDNFISSTFNIDGSGERPLKDALEFIVKGNVNSKAGTADVIISYEYSEDGKSFSSESKTLHVNKESDDIYLYNFHAESPDAADTVCTRFSSGASIRLAWESNADTYEIYAGSDSKPIYSGDETSYTYTSGITSDTTFTLKASKKVDGFSESILLETLAVDCTEPEVLALTVDNSLTVSGEATLKDSLTVEGAATLKGGLTVDGSAELKDSLTVDGSAELKNSLTVGGAATLKGGLTTEGTVKILGKAMQLTNVSGQMGDKAYVTVQASADGFLTVYMECTSARVNSRVRVRATTYRNKKSLITMQDDAYYVKAKCDGDEMIELVHCAGMTIPLSKDDSCIINCNMLKPAQSKLVSGYDLQIYFTPLGDGTAQFK